MKARRPVAALAAASLVIGLSALAPAAATAAPAKDAPTANAAAGTPSTKTINKRVNTARKQLRTTRRQVSTARRNINKLTTDLGAVARRLQAGEGSIGLLLGAAPQLITAVQKLGTEVPPALTALKNGLEALQAGVTANLTRLSDFTFAQEYGAGAIMTRLPGGSDDSVQSRTTPVVSPDIPDSGNPASANGTIPIAVSPTATPSTHPTAVQAGSKVFLGASIRSAEADGVGTNTPPAGQVGGLMIVKCSAGVLPAGPGATACSDDTTAIGGANGPLDDVEPGQVVCVVGPTPSKTFATPAGDKNLLLKDIQLKEALTATESPRLEIDTGFVVNPLSGGGANSFGGGDPADGDEGTCQLNRFGLYEVQAQFQFADIPTSASPGPKD